MAPAAIVIILAVIEYIVFGILVGRARGRYGIKAPATTGHEVFERYFRVHQNTLETLMGFIPGIALFALFVNPNWGAGIGLVYLIGRIVYLRYFEEMSQSAIAADVGVSQMQVSRLLRATLRRLGSELGSAVEEDAVG